MSNFITKTQRIGVEGQILHVKPGFMRNYLHIDNKACYITPNRPPRIPVVDIEEIRQEEQRKRRILQQQQAQQQRLLDQQNKEKATSTNKESIEDTENEGAMSLEELSDLFSSMKSNKRKSDVKPELKVQSSLVEESEEIITPTLEASSNDQSSQISFNLPKLITLNSSNLPISKHAILNQIQEYVKGTTLEPDQLSISYIDTPEFTIDQVTEVGRYQIKIISNIDGSDLTQILEVE
ncbi:uncharacterized protein KGF55_001513 [Candida pseudojiufengensis]|uniref:uncharacterized protein n=1 Tax=Candida pseudojiufengensis TaxID=497109 RepID=UPI0022258CF8|nr:uncharacterized protein KGF55_001513 [Candida pseudojiufengensis]KAI5965293.1 hypothetical protein KGF55_001513 [Candida pseudojiufengensis]